MWFKFDSDGSGGGDCVGSCMVVVVMDVILMW